MYRTNEREKKKVYEQRLREVEHSSFTPFVLSISGGIGNAATIFYKRLASLLAEKWDFPYSRTLGWLRCKLSFSLLRSAIQAIRGRLGLQVIKNDILPGLLLPSICRNTPLHRS